MTNTAVLFLVVLGSNLEPDIVYHELGFCYVTQSFQACYSTYLTVGHDLFLPYPFQFSIRFPLIGRYILVAAGIAQQV